MKKVRQTGGFNNKAAAKNSQAWWKARGYGARIRKVSGGYVVDLYQQGGVMVTLNQGWPGRAEAVKAAKDLNKIGYKARASKKKINGYYRVIIK